MSRAYRVRRRRRLKDAKTKLLPWNSSLISGVARRIYDITVDRLDDGQWTRAFVVVVDSSASFRSSRSTRWWLMHSVVRLAITWLTATDRGQWWSHDRVCVCLCVYVCVSVCHGRPRGSTSAGDKLRAESTDYFFRRRTSSTDRKQVFDAVQSRGIACNQCYTLYSTSHATGMGQKLGDWPLLSEKMPNILHVSVCIETRLRCSSLTLEAWTFACKCKTTVWCLSVCLYFQCTH